MQRQTEVSAWRDGQWHWKPLIRRINTHSNCPRFNRKLCIHTHARRRTRSHRYGGCPAATGNQDRASCYRSPMTLLIPSWLSLCSAPHIPPINRTACQLILPSWLLSPLPSILHGAPTKDTELPPLRPYQHFTSPPTTLLHDTWGSKSLFHTTQTSIIPSELYHSSKLPSLITQTHIRNHLCVLLISFSE